MDTGGNTVRDISDAEFEQSVIERSRSTPVLVDFWAPWCGPCRVLGPVLERVAGDLSGQMELAKIDTDKSPAIAQRYDIRGIPAVKLFVDGAVVAEFVGALPEAQVRSFLDENLPTSATKQARAGAERALADRDFAKAIELAGHVPASSPDWDRMQAVIALAEAATQPPSDEPLDVAYRAALDRAFARDHRGALEALLELVKKDKRWRDEAARKAMLAVFQLAGVRSPLSDEFRRELMFAL